MCRNETLCLPLPIHVFAGLVRYLDLVKLLEDNYPEFVRCLIVVNGEFVRRFILVNGEIVHCLFVVNGEFVTANH